MQDKNLEPSIFNTKDNQMKDLTTQLDTIFLLAPGKHEIRIIGRWYEVSVLGKKMTKCLLDQTGDRAAAYSIGLASSTKEAITMITQHFAMDQQELHNCFIVTNTVADDFSLEMKKRKIGSKWFSNITSFCTKAADIVAINSLIIDIDRTETAKTQQGQKLCASVQEMETLDLGRKEVVAFIAESGVKPSYQICSGNGYQIGIFFEHQTEIATAKKAVETILKGLKQKFLPSGISVDIALIDFGRVSRLCGMKNRKYDRVEELPDRTYRTSTLIENTSYSNQWENIVALATKLENTKANPSATQQKNISTPVQATKWYENTTPIYLAPSVPTAIPTTTKQTFTTEFDSESYVREIIALNGINIVKEKHDGNYKVMFCLEECLFDPSHKGGESAIVVNNNGKICYQCFHDHCSGHTWTDAKSQLRLPEKKAHCKTCGSEIHWEQNKQNKWCPKNLDGTTHRCKKTSKPPQAPKTADSDIVWLNDKGKVLPGLAAQAFFTKQKNTLIFVSGAFWRYGKGYWEKVKDEIIMQEIRDMIGREKTSKKVIEDIKFCLELEALSDNHKWNPSPEKLCFQNCILNTKTMQTEPHNKDLLQTNRFEWEYFPHGCPDTASFLLYMHENAPLWMNYLETIQFKQDAIDRLQEWMGLCLVPVTKMERCLFLKGEGRNGKGVFLHVLRNLIGESQVSSLDLDQLFDRFSKIGIQNKLINIGGDIDTDIVFSNKFKGMVSGETITAEDKYKKNEKFNPYARFIFAANDYPVTKDRSPAFYKRFDIVEFQKEFAEEEQNKDLKENLMKELPAIMHWALEGLKRLVKNNWIFSASATFDKTKESFKLASNHVLQFVASNFVINTKTDTPHWYSCKAFRTLYKDWCIDNGYKMLSEENLGKDMKRIGIRRERQSTGQRLYIYVGITPIDSAINEAETSITNNI